MEIYKIISDIMRNQNLSVADIAKKSNLPDSTVRGIITRKQKNIALEVAFKISQGLGVSLEYLNGMPEKQQTTNNTYINQDKHPLIQIYNNLNSAGQNKLMDYAKDLSQLSQYKKCDTISEQEISYEKEKTK